MATPNEDPTIFEPRKTVVATNLSSNVRMKTLEKLFSLYGPITYMKLLPPTHRCATYHVVVVYSEETAAYAAVYTLKSHVVKRRRLNISYLWSSAYQNAENLEVGISASREEYEKRVVYMENFYVGTDIADLITEFKKFGTIVELHLIAKTKPYSVRVTYKSSFSAAAATALAILHNDSVDEVKVSLLIGKLREEPYHLMSRIKSKSTVRIIGEAGIRGLCQKVEQHMFLTRVINTEIQSSYLSCVSEKTLNTEKEIVPLCQSTKCNASALEILATKDEEVPIFVEIDFHWNDNKQECAACRKDTITDRMQVLSTITPSMGQEGKYAYLLLMTVLNPDGHRTGFYSLCECGKCKPENAGQSGMPKETPPLGCVLLRIYVEPRKTTEGEIVPKLEFLADNLDHLCPNIIRPNDMRCRPGEKIPKKLLRGRGRSVDFERKDELKMEYNAKSHNPCLPHVSCLGVVKITCTLGKGDIFEFPVVYYPSFTTPAGRNLPQQGSVSDRKTE